MENRAKIYATFTLLLLTVLPLQAQPSDIVWVNGGGLGRITATALAPDKSLIAAADGAGRVLVRDGLSGVILHRFEVAPREGHSLFFSDDGSELTLAQSGAVFIWHLASGAVRTFRTGSIGLVEAFLLTGGDRIALVDRDGEMRIHTYPEGNVIKQVSLGVSGVSSAGLMADSSIITLRLGSQMLRSWDIAGDSLLPAAIETYRNTAEIFHAASPRAPIIAGPLSATALGIWDVRAGVLVDSIELDGLIPGLGDYVTWTGGRNPIVEAVFSAGGDSIILHSDDGVVVVYEWSSDTPQQIFGDGFPYVGMRFPDTPGLGLESRMIVSGDGRTLVLAVHKTAGDYAEGRLDPYVERLDLAADSGAGIAKRLDLSTNYGPVTDVALSLDGMRAVTISPYTLANWNLRDASYSIGRSGAPRIAYSTTAPDGSGVLSYESVFIDSPGGPTGPQVEASATGIGNIRLSPSDGVSQAEMAIAPGGRYALIAGRIHSSSSPTFELPITGFRAVAFSYDTVHLGLMRADTLFLWNCRAAALERTFVPDTRMVLLAFSRDGALVACGLESGEAVVYDIPSGAELTRLAGHAGGITSIAFAQHDRFIVTAGADSTIRTWEISTGRNDYTYRELRDVTTAVDAAQSGAFILAGTRDGAVMLWRGRGAIAGAPGEGRGATELAFHANTVQHDELVVTTEAVMGGLTVELVDVLGNVVLRADGIGSAGRAVVDVRDIPAGRYLCRLASDGASGWRHIMIVR